MRLVLVDHYDSFTANVLDWLAAGEGPPATVDLVSFDDPDGMERVRSSGLPVVLSPGPKRPEDAAPTVALARALIGRVPLLGVCLGHQVLAHAAGARVVRGRAPAHGTRRTIVPSGSAPLLADAASSATPPPGPFAAATYNSLVVADGTLPAPWVVTARCAEHGEIQAIARLVPGEAPAFGLQFHPESFLSEHAGALRRAWLEAAAAPAF